MMMRIQVFCDKCNKNLDVEVNSSILDNAPSYPVPYAYIHGDPSHLIIIYLDRFGKIRNIFTSEHVFVESAPKLDYKTIHFVLETITPPLETEDTIFIKYKSLMKGDLSKEQFIDILAKLEKMNAIERRRRPDGIYLIKKMSYREWLEEYGKEKKIEIHYIPEKVKPFASGIADVCMTLIRSGVDVTQVRNALAEVEQFTNSNKVPEIPSSNPLKNIILEIFNKFGLGVLQTAIPYVIEMVPHFREKK